MTRISGRIVRPGAVIPGYVEIDGPAILEVGSDHRAGDDVIVPGFVDLHCHGGGGHTFTTGDVTAARGARDFHLAHGTTTMLASLVSSPFELMRDATAGFRPLVEAGVLAGVHFEGPYLSAARCGAQNPGFLRDPSIDELTKLIELGAGAVRMVTVAPELPGAPEAIAFLRAHGVLAAIGHTDATYEQTEAGIAAGAEVGTHVFNGMRPPHHREPGPVIGLLASTVTCELIADNIHLHPGMLAFAAHTAGPDRTALITDAMDAAGMPDGRYDAGRPGGGGGRPGGPAGPQRLDRGQHPDHGRGPAQRGRPPGSAWRTRPPWPPPRRPGCWVSATSWAPSKRVCAPTWWCWTRGCGSSG